MIRVHNQPAVLGREQRQDSHVVIARFVVLIRSANLLRTMLIWSEVDHYVLLKRI